MNMLGGDAVVSSGRATLMRRKDGKFILYLPKDFCEDSKFPFQNFGPGKRTSRDGVIYTKVTFELGRIIVEPWVED